MKTLEKNVANAFGQKGNEWFHHLSEVIKELAQLWQLSHLKPVSNMNWNYVALANQHHNIPVVLKISCDPKLMENEYKALKHFNGCGAVSVLDRNVKYNALLLEQAIPGNLLKEDYSQSIVDTIKIYADVVKNLASKPLLNKNDFTHVNDWLETIDKIADPRIEKRFVDKAKKSRSKLLASIPHEYLCHGDLHLENIIQHDERWLVIDPKGIVGEMAFEAAAFDLISKEEIKNNSDIASLIKKRVTLLSENLELDFNRLLSWIFLRFIISAQWFIEDKGDPTHMLILANNILPSFNMLN